MKLSRTELYDINRRMLNLGAPVDIDGVGYNKIDFGRMVYLADKTPESYTEFDLYKICDCLANYKNTQLKDYADRIEETRSVLYDIIKQVSIVKFTDKYVQLTWKFNKNVSEFIKNTDKELYKWIKADVWIFQSDWSVIDRFLKVFEENGFDVSKVQELKSKIENGEKVEGMIKEKGNTTSSKTPNKIFKINVQRSRDSTDTLILRSEYHKDLIYAIKGGSENCFYNSSDRTWEFYIEDSSKMYSSIKNSGVEVDLSDLEPWKNLVDGWSKNYNPVQLSSLPFKPYDFQIEDVKTLMEKRWAINGNEMGCGKTFEDNWAAFSIPLPKLIICPPTLRLNWEKEIKMVDPDADVTILYDNSEFKTSMWTIIGYPAVSKHLENLEKAQFQVVVIDEAHFCQAIRNSGEPDSQRAWAVLRVAATAGWVIPTTGTPKTNRNKNLFNILKMIRHPLTRGKWAFRDYGIKYCEGTRGSWGWDFEGNSNDDELHQLISPYMVRHLKKEVLPHLKKMRRSIPVNVDLTEYDYEISEYLRNRESSEAEQLARLMRARKILATQKVGETIDFAKEMVSEGKKVVIVTCFTDVVKVLEKAFKGNVVKIVGGMSDTAKEAAKDEFQKGKAQVIILNIIAGGVGITLTASNNLILNDFDWVPGNIQQVEDRICRGGQTEEFSNIYYITAKGADAEEEFVSMLTYKSDTINAAVDGGNGDTIDFRSLVEKAAGVTRTSKVHKMSQIPEGAQKSQVCKSDKIADSNSVDYKSKTTEELTQELESKGLTYKKCGNENINRMRVIMALKNHS